MPSLIVKWRTMHDEKVCPVCDDLERSGYTWVLSTGHELVLSHPEYGDVWNIQVGSEAHGSHDGSCRCELDFDFDYTDLVEVITKLRDKLLGKNQEQPIETVEVPKL